MNNTRKKILSITLLSLGLLLGSKYFFHALSTKAEVLSINRITTLPGTILSPGNGTSTSGVFSGNGQFVVFQSDATDLVPGDTNGYTDIFVLNRTTNELERVNVATDGTQANFYSNEPYISYDGRYVVFSTNATNLVADDQDGHSDIFIRDRQLNTTERVSVATDGTQGDLDSYSGTLSADGRYVSFYSYATNLVAGDTNNFTDVFVRDRQLNTTERVSVATDGSEGDSDALSIRKGISADGRYVQFTSGATNLVAGDTNGHQDGFIRDRQLNTTERVSVATDGSEGDDTSGIYGMSDNARYIIIGSLASNLVAGDTNGKYDIFIRDRQLNTTERVSVATDGTEGNDSSFGYNFSADNRYLLMYSDSATLVSGDTNGSGDVFVRDLQLDTTERISLSSSGAQGNGYSTPNDISPDGRYVLFQASATNLVQDDINNRDDLLIRDIQEGTTDFVFSFVTSNGFNNHSETPSISKDNKYIAFSSDASNIVPDDTNGQSDVFVFNRITGVTQRVSVASDGSEGDGDSGNPIISEDGRYVMFDSSSENLVLDDSNNTYDIFVHDIQTGSTERVNIATDGTEADNESFDAFMTPDGRYIVFASDATNLVADDTNDQGDIFVRDTILHQTTRVNVSSEGQEANESSDRATISADGRYVTFESGSDNLVAGDTNEARDIFLHDRQTGETIRISQRIALSHGNDSSTMPTFSGDGNYIVFLSDADDLVTGDTNSLTDVFVVNRTTGVIERVNVATDGTQAENGSIAADISADGRYVVFSSHADNLVADDTNNDIDVFLHDRQTGITSRMSVKTDGTEGDGSSYEPRISRDGTTVVFLSDSGNLVDDDTNSQSDIFVHTILTGVTQRASIATDTTEANGNSYVPSVSETGRYVAFHSIATNLVGDDTSDQSDIFVHDMNLGTTVRVNLASGGVEAQGFSIDADISADGNHVVFDSSADNLVAGDTNGEIDTFIATVSTGAIERVSVASDESEANGQSRHSRISPDGTHVVFYSTADNLVPEDLNEESDVFVRDVVAGTTQRVNIPNDGYNADTNELDYNGGFSFSTDNRYVLFASNSILTSGFDIGNGSNLFIRDIQTQTTTPAVPGFETILQTENRSESAAISADGNYIAFISRATNLVTGDTNNAADIFVYNRNTKGIERVSTATDGTQGNEPSGENISISSDGTYVGFFSDADNLVADDTNGQTDLFLRDRNTGQTIRVNVAMDGTQAEEQDTGPFMVSADGKYVVFSGSAKNLVPGDTDNNQDIFLVNVLQDTESSSTGSSSGGSAPLGLRPVGSDIKNQPPSQNPEQPPISETELPGACIAKHFDVYVKRGAIGLKVVRIQQFLTEQGFYTGPVNGYFGPKTEAAVKRFQAKYKAQILSPWKLSSPTGVWALTTRAMANTLESCSEGTITLPNGTTVQF